MTAFDRYIGIDYSGAETPDTPLAGLQIYMAKGCDMPVRVPVRHPPPRKHWTRKEVAEWLIERLSEGIPTLVGIDHGFSFPIEYFKRHKLELDWGLFLDDFQEHWPTDEPDVWVRDIRKNPQGKGLRRGGEKNWKRMTEKCARGSKSVFNFGVNGEVATSTHAGLPWLRYIRNAMSAEVHFWPFDGWEIPIGKSAIAEVYPSLWSRSFPREKRNGHQQDAYAVARWLAAADRSGDLNYFLNPKLPIENSELVQRAEGWILGVEYDKLRLLG